MKYEDMTARELDMAVAERVMGWSPVYSTMDDGSISSWLTERGNIRSSRADFYPSRWIQNAFEVVEAMRERGFDEVDIKSWRTGWLVTFWDGTLDGDIGDNQDALPLPRAICIAALRALNA